MKTVLTLCALRETLGVHDDLYHAKFKMYLIINKFMLFKLNSLYLIHTLLVLYIYKVLKNH